MSTTQQKTYISQKNLSQPGGLPEITGGAYQPEGCLCQVAQEGLKHPNHKSVYGVPEQ